jgi:hypothetical protein
MSDSASHQIRSIVPRDAKLATDVDALFQRSDHTVFARRRAGGRAVHELVVHRAGADTQLATLLHHGVTRVATVCRDRIGAIELVLDEAVMRVLVLGRDNRLVDDAGPDG